MTVKTLQRATQLTKLSKRNKKKLRYKENKKLDLIMHDSVCFTLMNYKILKLF